MSTQHIETRRKIKSISEIKIFNDLLDRSTLNPKQKELIKLYRDRRNFRNRRNNCQNMA